MDPLDKILSVVVDNAILVVAEDTEDEHNRRSVRFSSVLRIRIHEL